MYFADFIKRVFQIINRPGLSQAYTAVTFGVIATPELDYWEISAEPPQGKGVMVWKEPERSEGAVWKE